MRSIDLSKPVLSAIPWENNMSLITRVCLIAVLARRIARGKALPSNFSAGLDIRWLKPDTPVVNHRPLAIETSIKARQSLWLELKCGRCTTSESGPLQILDNSKLKSWRFSRCAGFWRKIVLLGSLLTLLVRLSLCKCSPGTGCSAIQLFAFDSLSLCRSTPPPPPPAPSLAGSC